MTLNTTAPGGRPDRVSLNLRRLHATRHVAPAIARGRGRPSQCRSPLLASWLSTAERRRLPADSFMAARGSAASLTVGATTAHRLAAQSLLCEHHGMHLHGHWVGVALALTACGGGTQPSNLSPQCQPGQSPVDGTCVTQSIADYVVCVRSRGSTLVADNGKSLSAEAGYAGAKASTTADAKNRLETTYRDVSDPNFLEIIRDCYNKTLPSGSGLNPKPGSDAVATDPKGSTPPSTPTPSQASPPASASCAMSCEGDHGPFNLSSGRVYDINVEERQAGDAVSFTLHANDPKVLDIKAGEKGTSTQGPVKLHICTKEPGTGGGCDASCANTGHGVKFSTSRYSVKLGITCE